MTSFGFSGKSRSVVIAAFHGAVFLEHVEGLQLFDDVVPLVQTLLDRSGILEVLVLHEGVVDPLGHHLGILGVTAPQVDQLKKEEKNKHIRHFPNRRVLERSWKAVAQNIFTSLVLVSVVVAVFAAGTVVPAASSWLPQTVPVEVAVFGKVSSSYLSPCPNCNCSSWQSFV